MNANGGNDLSSAKSPVAPMGADTSAINDAVAGFEQRLATLRHDVVALEHERTTLEASLTQGTLSLATLENALGPILEQEAGVVQTLKEVNVKERSAQDPKDRRVHEQARWHHIEKWYAVEQEKWTTQEKLDAVKKEITEHQRHHDELVAKEHALRTQIESIEIEEEKTKLYISLNAVVEKRTNAERILESIAAMKEKVSQRFTEVVREEEGIETKESQVESMLLSAHSLADERAYADERYTLEKKRHEVEQERWNIEDQLAKIGTSTQETEQQLREMREKEEEIIAKLAGLDRPIP